MDGDGSGREAAVPPAAKQLQALQHKLEQRLQVALDVSTPHITYRWLAWGLVVLLYLLRVFLLKGFYIITYGLGIYNLNLVLGFLSPQIDPETESPELPTKSDQEFKPFVRRLPEFKFWYSSVKSFLMGMVMTLFPVFDVPVFWPILLLYWIVLFAITMKRQIKHMIKYKYLPWSTGKKKYVPGEGKKASGAAGPSRAD